MGPRKSGLRPALAGLCLIVMPAMQAPLFAADAGESPPTEVQPADAGSPGSDGALYSPFSTAANTATEPAPSDQAAATSADAQKADNGSPGLVTASVTVLVVAGGLAMLVRALLAA